MSLTYDTILHMKEIEKKYSKLQAVIITLATVIIGLASYIYYISNTNKELANQRCEYNGWAYADGESFPASDDCNTCICSDGEVVCTEIVCTEEPVVCGPEENCD